MAGVRRLTRRAHALVIVGAGPAGLAAANAYLAAGGQDLLVLDAGRALDARRRDDPRDVVRGVGGAGLFSDGKFSFFPAATGLWQLEDAALLRAAYGWTTRVLAGAGLDAPAFPGQAAFTGQPDRFKPYPCATLGLAARRELIRRLAAPLGDRLRLGTRVVGLTRDGWGWRLTLRVGRRRRVLRARCLIGAGGRFFPLGLQEAPVPTAFLRVELGVRLEGPADHPFFADLVAGGESIDPKLILRDAAGALEWRTFCCCRRGELVRARSDGLVAFSGRADGPVTDRSNVGFNVRFLSPAAARGVRLEGLGGPFRVPLAAALRDPGVLASGLGGRAAVALARGLRRLAERVPALTASAPAPLAAVGPAIEGVGAYPRTDGGLASPGLPVLFAGDAAGRFRGIVAALVSGAYVGRRAVALDLAPRAVAAHGVRPHP